MGLQPLLWVDNLPLRTMIFETNTFCLHTKLWVAKINVLRLTKNNKTPFLRFLFSFSFCLGFEKLLLSVYTLYSTIIFVRICGVSRKVCGNWVRESVRWSLLVGQNKQNKSNQNKTRIITGNKTAFLFHLNNSATLHVSTFL